MSKKAIEETFSLFRRSTLRIRLIIAGPLFTSLLVLLTGIVILRITELKLTNLNVPEDSINQLVSILKLVLVGCTLIAGVGGFFLSYVIVKPVRKMTETAHAIATTGHFTSSQEMPAHVEIDALQSTFNKMVTSLQNHAYERNKYILESMAGALITLDSNGKIMTINNAAESLLGIPTDLSIGKTIFELLPEFPENIRVREMLDNSIHRHITYSSEEVIIHTHQVQKLPIGMSISLLKDETKQLIGVVVTFKDLSKIKQIHQQLQRSDRLAAIGTLATGLAHEIRNPLGSIRGLAQLLAEDMKPEDPKTRYAQVIIKEIDRLNHVVQELLTFSQASSSGMEFNDINIALRDALFIGKQSPKYKQNIKIIEQYDTQIPLVKIEKEKLIQAFLNIILNALEASGSAKNGEPIVEVRSTLGEARTHYPVPNLGFSIIEISNTGEPIPQDRLDHIFDPFFTTKETGTGLGLAIAHQIIASHSGLIEVTSDKENGTIFQISIPIIKETEELAIGKT